MTQHPKSIRVRLAAAALALAGAGHAAADPAADYRQGLAAYERDDVIGAMQLLGKAADANYAPAQAFLGYILDQAEENEAARDLYRRAAEQGNARGQHGLGMLYALGEGVEQNDAEARKWISMSAEGGYGPALSAMADAYLHGRLGLEADREKALEFLRRGAAQGYQPAQRVLDELESPPAQPRKQ